MTNRKGEVMLFFLCLCDTFSVIITDVLFRSVRPLDVCQQNAWFYVEKHIFACFCLKSVLLLQCHHKERLLVRGDKKKRLFKGKKIVLIMKKMMILVTAIMMSVAANAIEKMNVKPFEGVSVNVPARVRFVYGENYGVDVQSNDSLTASGIRLSVQNGVLKIRSIDESENVEGLYITIVSPVEPRLTVGRDMEVKNAVRNEESAEKKPRKK